MSPNFIKYGLGDVAPSLTLDTSVLSQAVFLTAPSTNARVLGISPPPPRPPPIEVDISQPNFVSSSALLQDQLIQLKKLMNSKTNFVRDGI